MQACPCSGRNEEHLPVEASSFRWRISVLLHSGSVRFDLHLKLKLYNRTMSNKIHANNLNFFFFISFGIKSQINNTIRSHGKNEKALYLVPLMTLSPCFLHKGLCVFILHWAGKCYNWPYFAVGGKAGIPGGGDSLARLPPPWLL